MAAATMDRPSEKTPNGTSPHTYALNHLRPKHSFTGCSRISDYELLGKLGEGTFGYVSGPTCPTHDALFIRGRVCMHDTDTRKPQRGSQGPLEKDGGPHRAQEDHHASRKRWRMYMLHFDPPRLFKAERPDDMLTKIESTCA